MEPEESALREVSKDEFKDVYVRLGGGAATGWTLRYWERCIEPGVTSKTRFLVELPPSPRHTRMMVVSDAREHRLFFMTEEAEDELFRAPGD